MARNAEQVLISAVLHTGDIGEALDAGVTKEWFRDYPAEWGFISARFKRTRMVPSIKVFRLKFPKFRILDVDDLDYGIGEIRTHHAKQSFMLLMDGAVQGLEAGGDPRDLITHMHRGLVDLSGEMTGKENETDLVSDWKHSYAAVMARAKARSKGLTYGLPTGYGTLDLVSGGLKGGEYWVFAARLGQGKTWSLVRLATEVLKRGKNVQFHALEQTRTQLGLRFAPFLSRHLGDGKTIYKTSALQNGSVDVLGYRKFMEGLAGQTKGGLLLDDTPRGKLTPLALQAKIERNEPDLVIIDYLGLMNSQAGDWSAIASLSAEIKEMAVAYDIPIVVANQLNRTASIGNKHNGPEALSGADAIGQDADGVITMRKLSKRTGSMFLAKYRHGEDGMNWPIHFEPDVGIFDETTEQKAMDLRDEDLAAE